MMVMISMLWLTRLRALATVMMSAYADSPLFLLWLSSRTVYVCITLRTIERICHSLYKLRGQSAWTCDCVRIWHYPSQQIISLIFSNFILLSLLVIQQTCLSTDMSETLNFHFWSSLECKCCGLSWYLSVRSQCLNRDEVRWVMVDTSHLLTSVATI